MSENNKDESVRLISYEVTAENLIHLSKELEDEEKLLIRPSNNNMHHILEVELIRVSNSGKYIKLAYEEEDNNGDIAMVHNWERLSFIDEILEILDGE